MYGDPDLIAWIKSLRVENPQPPPPAEPPRMCPECGLEPPTTRDYLYPELCRVCVREARRARKRSSAQKSREKRAGTARLTALDRRIANDYVTYVLRHRPCEYCKAAPFEHLEHRVPLSRGGTGHWWNLTSSCAADNLRKGTKTDDEYKAILRQETEWAE